MDLDMHYYSAYVAALYVGYTPDEAQTIAHASEYIDDSTSDIAKKASYIGGGKTLTFDPIKTFCTETQMFSGWIPNDKEIIQFRRMLAPFHFLPGNYKSKTHSDPDAEKRILPYTGEKSYNGYFSDWKYGPRTEWEFKLMSLPRSPLVEAMINDTIDNHKGHPYEKYLIGARMHVLMDTWSHMYYSGSPCWSVNEVIGDVFDTTDNNNKKIEWGLFGNDELCAPASPSYLSAAYAGHARMGHIPDYPWLTFKYNPKWSKDTITKVTSEAFLTGFTQMITALSAIKNGTKFSALNDLTTIDPDLLAAVKNILNFKWPLGTSFSRVLDLCCKQWKDSINNGSIKINNKPIPLPAEYSANKWVQDAEKAGKYDSWKNTFKDAGGLKNSEYYLFDTAAKIHQSFVLSILTDEGLKLDDPPPMLS